MHHLRQVLAACTAVVLLSVAGVVAVPDGFQNEVWISGLAEPTVIAFLPDGRLLVAQRGGIVRVAAAGTSQLAPTPLLQLTNIDIGGGERGLVGLTADPRFPSAPYVYLFYTAASPLRDRVSRFTVSGDTASLSSEVVLWQDAVPAHEWHHGGTVAFGPDGHLYVSTGDHFTPSDSQSLTSYHGKILRLAADGSVPADNPFHDGSGPNLDAIWARGLRNPFRFSFDRIAGTMYIGDVGGNEAATSIEEVNVGVAGANYGWPVCEGPCTTAGMANPAFTYPHANRDASITGGFVYRHTVFPAAYHGSYFFADYARNWIRRLTLSAPGTVSGVVGFEPADGSEDGPYGEIVDLKEGPDGAIYYVDIGSLGGVNAGTVRRIRYTLGNAPPAAQAAAVPAAGAAPLVVAFSSAGSFDPEGATLTYEWDFGDGQASTEANPSHVYVADGTYTARLIVSDGTLQTQSTPVTIRVGTPPAVTLAALPATFRAGDTIPVSIAAVDAEDGPLSGSDVTWSVVFHHDTHQHPFLGPVGGTSGAFTAPASGHDFSGFTRFEVIATATDRSGLSSSVSAFSFPQKVAIGLDTMPTGLALTVDGIVRQAPVVLDSLVGFQHALTAPSPQTQGGVTYAFSSWSDGGAAAHVITTPAAPLTLSAGYQASAGPVTVTRPIAAGVDDVNEVATTYQDNGSTVWVGTGGSAAASYAGLRFAAAIPRDSVIASARLEVNAAQTQWLSIGYEIGIENSSAGAVFGSAARPSARLLTARRVTHSSNAQWQQHAWYSLGEVGPLLQDVVNRGDWTADSPAVFVIRGTTGTWGRKFAHSHDGQPAAAPRLVVTFTPPASPGGTAPTLDVGDASTVEGDGGTTVLTFPVTLSAPAAAQVSVSYTTGDDTASSPSDFTAAAGTVELAAGQVAAVIAVTVAGDTTPEADERFVVTLANPSGAVIGDGQAVGTIVNDDAAPPVVAIGDVTVSEGAAAASFPVTLSAPSAQAVSVEFTTSAGTATAGADFAAVSGTVTIAAGATQGAAVVPLVADALDEPAETFTVTLSTPVNASIGDGQAAGTIVDDDPAPVLTVADVSVAEGDAATSPAIFTVTLSGLTSLTVTVTYATASGTATAGDFTPTSGSLVFPPGTTALTLAVPIVGDAGYEPDETFTVALSNAANAVIGDAQAVGTIRNDDAAPPGPITATFQVAATTDDVNEAGADYQATQATVWLGNGGTATTSYTGLRFTGVDVPRGAAIVSARLEVNAAQTQWIGLQYQIGVDDTGNSGAFTTTARPSGRLLAAPRVNHSSNVQWTAGTWYGIDGLGPLVQAIVGRTDWTPLNGLSLVLRGTGTNWGRKFVRSRDAGAATAPRLIVVYQPPAP